MDYRGYSPVSAVSRDSRSSLSERGRSQDQSSQESTRMPQEESELPNENAKSPQDHTVASTKLHRSFWILIIASFYTMLALSSWTILCILNYRPLTTKSYKPVLNLVDGHADFHQLSFQANENWYQAARVIQSITGVLTIPLTSAVCSNAAVVFIQQYGKSSNMTVRKLLALADKSWTSTDLYWQLVKGPYSCWKRYFTSFLLVAVALHLVGALIAPLQALFLSSKTIKIPTSPRTIDYTELFAGDIMNDSTGLTLGKIASAALPVLRSVSDYQYYPQVWQADHERDDRTPELPSFTILTDPFVSLFPNDFSTGLYRQFAQRLNTTAHAVFVPTPLLHDKCTPDRSFYRHYNGTGWSVTACAPVLQDEHGWKSQWRESRDRQDISEELYLSFNFTELNKLSFPGDYHNRVASTLKITANTTSGWFELPNYMNSGKFGPLQAADPKNMSTSTLYQMDNTPPPMDRNNGDLQAIEDLAAPGPLLSLVYSIFGANDSYISTCVTALNDADFSTRVGKKNIEYCSKPPLMDLLSSPTSEDGHRYMYNEYDGTSNTNFKDWNTFTHWLMGFGYPGEDNDTWQIQDAFDTGLNLVNIAWLEQAQLNGGNYVGVLQDFGDDTQTPVISMAGIVVVSVLLAIFLTSLLCVASFAALSPRWTNSLDGFAMMRIGASVADRVPLLVSYKADKINALDKMPGWIGGVKINSDKDDIQDDCNHIAKIELGSSCRLRRKQKYACYEVDGTLDDKTAKDVHTNI